MIADAFQTLDEAGFVDRAGVHAPDFHIDPADQQRLFDNGVAAARAWLADDRRVPAP
jgi:hypothetical protein